MENKFEPIDYQEELIELGYQSKRIADALHYIKDAMFDIFTHGKGYENETIAEIMYKISNSIKENERIEANRNEEQNRATRDDSSSMPRKN
jgi:hypothetical protein